MNPRTLLILVVALVGCVHTITSARNTDEAPRFALTVRMDETFNYAEVDLLSADGGRLHSERFDAGHSWITTGLSTGPNQYVISTKAVRVDGGTLVHSLPFELKRNDVEVTGQLWLDNRDVNARAYLELHERVPEGLKLEATSPTSREGTATYVVTNGSDRKLYPSLFEVQLQRRASAGWELVRMSECMELSPHSIAPGEQRVFRAEESLCLNNPLPEGQYRHVIQLTENHPLSGGDQYRRRNIQLSREFDTRASSPQPSVAFADVPVSQLRAGNGHGLRLVAPDGGSICACYGDVVGLERRQLTRGIGGRPCFADTVDASVVSCEPIQGWWQNLGDHPPFPFRGNEPVPRRTDEP